MATALVLAIVRSSPFDVIAALGSAGAVRLATETTFTVGALVSGQMINGVGETAITGGS